MSLKWKRTQIGVQLVEGFDSNGLSILYGKNIPGQVSGPFALHHTFGRYAQSHPHTLSHLPSGMRIAAFASSSAAKHVAAALPALLPLSEWDTVDSPESFARTVSPETIQAIRELIEEHGGVRYANAELHEDWERLQERQREPAVGLVDREDP